MKKKTKKAISPFLFFLFFLVFSYQHNAFAYFEENNLNLLYTNKISDIKSPLKKNIGQVNENIKFYTEVLDGFFYITDGELVYDFRYFDNDSEKYRGYNIREIFVNSKNFDLSTRDESFVDINYFKGEKYNWKYNIPSYYSLSLGYIWEGVSVEVKAYQNNIEKIFTVLPKKSPDVIKIYLDGAESLYVNENGELVINTGEKNILMTKPVAFQEIEGELIYVEVEYIVDDKTYGFRLGDYNNNFPLIIDPLLASTYFGGNSTDISYSIALDSSGNVFIVGETQTTATTFPLTSGAYDITYNGLKDVFVSKFNSELTQLLSSTYLGGTSDDVGTSIKIDSSDNVFISGFTNSTNYPTVSGSYDLTHNGGYDIFVSKLNNSLTSLLASTYIGGTNNDYSGNVNDGSYNNTNLLALDSSGNVFVVGYSNSNNYPVVAGSYKTTYGGTNDAVVSKLNNNLSSLLASTYLNAAGASNEYATGVDIDSNNNVFVVGSTNNSFFPTTVGVYNPSHNGLMDVFISKLNNNLSSLLASTFFGTNNSEYGRSIKIDSNNNVFILSLVLSSSFPTTVGAYDTTFNGGTYDAAVSKFNNDLTSILASTYLGGSSDDYPVGFEINPLSDNVFVVGVTNSANFPVTSGAHQTTASSSGSIHISELNNNLNGLVTSTYFSQGVANGISFDALGNIYITGQNNTIFFPITAGAYDTTNNGGGDAFISKFSNLSSITNPTISSVDATNINNISAVLNSSFTIGSFGSVEVRFAYKKSSDSTFTNTDWQSYTSSGTHSETIQNLDPNTEYQFKAQLRYNSTEIENAIVIFKTTEQEVQISDQNITTIAIPTSNLNSRVNNLIRLGDINGALNLIILLANNLSQYMLLQSTDDEINKFVFHRDLTIGDAGEDVRRLQIFLNNKGYTLTQIGPGSVGNESNLFGVLTRNALVRFQTDNGISPSIGYFGPISRALINSIID